MADEFSRELGLVLGIGQPVISKCLALVSKQAGISQESVADLIRKHYDVDRLSSLPSEIVMMLLTGAGPKEILQFCATSKTNQQFCEDPHLWSALLKRDFQIDDKTQGAKNLYKKLGAWRYNICSLITSDESKTFRDIVNATLDGFFLLHLSFEQIQQKISACQQPKQALIQKYGITLADMIFYALVGVIVHLLIEGGVFNNASTLAPGYSMYMAVIEAITTPAFFNLLSGMEQLDEIIETIKNLLVTENYIRQETRHQDFIEEKIQDLREWVYQLRNGSNGARNNPLYPSLNKVDKQKIGMISTVASSLEIINEGISIRHGESDDEDY